MGALIATLWLLCGVIVMFCVTAISPEQRKKNRQQEENMTEFQKKHHRFDVRMMWCVLYVTGALAGPVLLLFPPITNQIKENWPNVKTRLGLK